MTAMAIVTENEPTRRQVFYGTFVQCVDTKELEYWHDTGIAVSEGVIVAIAKDISHENIASVFLPNLGWSIEETTIVKAPVSPDGPKSQFFFPGFIDTHVHASQYPNIGIFGKSTLLDWLNTYTFPLESSLTNVTKAHRVYTACVRRTLAHGTTTASYYATQSTSSTTALASVCQKLGQRAFVGRVCMDHADMCPDFYKDESVEEAVAASRESILEMRKVDATGDLVSPIITPRFAPTCTTEAMQGLAALAKEFDLPIQTHLSENISECALVGTLFPTAGSYSKVYEEAHILGPRTVLAHCVHLSEEEAQLLAHRKCKISHCPGSNTAITSGVARVRWLLDRQLDVGLGTDMGAGYSPSILEAARQAVMASHVIAMDLPEGEQKEHAKLAAEEALYMATKGGAKVLGLEDKVGGFAVGLQWDAIQVGLDVVDDAGERPEASFGGNVDIFGWESWDEVMVKWLYNGDDRNCRKVWVKGRLVHEAR